MKTLGCLFIVELEVRSLGPAARPSPDGDPPRAMLRILRFASGHGHHRERKLVSALEAQNTGEFSQGGNCDIRFSGKDLPLLSIPVAPNDSHPECRSAVSIPCI